MTAQLDHKGWACGQDIIVHGEVVNNTTRIIHKVTILIEQVNNFYSLVLSTSSLYCSVHHLDL